MARTSSSGEFKASIRARASSVPGSVSKMIFFPAAEAGNAVASRMAAAANQKMMWFKRFRIGFLPDSKQRRSLAFRPKCCQGQMNNPRGDSRPGCPAERSSAIRLGKNFVELRSTGQPRAAVPTWAEAHERGARAHIRGAVQLESPLCHSRTRHPTEWQAT